MHNIFLGIVVEGKFNLLYPKPDFPGGEIRFTKIRMMEARSPESEEIHFHGYEGSAVAVQGDGGDSGWVHSARVVDTGGPIVTALVRQVFGERAD